MSVDELRGQISVLLRKIDLLEHQGVELETEVLKLKEIVRDLRTHSAEVLDKLQPASKRERSILGRLSSLAEYAEQLQRTLLTGSVPDAWAAASTVPRAVGPARPTAPPVPAVDPVQVPAVLFGARWSSARVAPGEVAHMTARAPGYDDEEIARIDVSDARGERVVHLETSVDDDEVDASWTAPRPGRYRFTVEVAGRTSSSDWLEVGTEDAPPPPAPDAPLAAAAEPLPPAPRAPDATPAPATAPEEPAESAPAGSDPGEPAPTD